MEWEVLFDEEFDVWLTELDEGLQDEIWSHIQLDLERLAEGEGG